jgi:hypothetical protein
MSKGAIEFSPGVVVDPLSEETEADGSADGFGGLGYDVVTEL